MIRRKFLQLGSAGITASILSSCATKDHNITQITRPIVISTWAFGMEANKGAWKVLNTGGTSIDAVEAGVRITESDGSNASVGYGGFPDKDGFVTLDACIMDSFGNCGSVAYLKNIIHPISVARLVMEKTPHVMLVGDGAKKFALANGMEEVDLHTENSRQAYEDWKVKSEYTTEVNREKHDTIGMLAIDKSGNISGACTTSGMAFKLPGRVGDSPIIGAGLYVDNEIGGAVATGLGEEIIRVSGSAIIIELMRQGATPEQACKELVDRVKKRNKSIKDVQVCFIALDKNGNHAGYSMHSGFEYALKSNNGEEVIKTKCLIS
jgi:isoaspartyl peptidase/L-asparaginase-like protein (Ntn-hydrolase superfamily)